MLRQDLLFLVKQKHTQTAIQTYVEAVAHVHQRVLLDYPFPNKNEYKIYLHEYIGSQREVNLVFAWPGQTGDEIRPEGIGDMKKTGTGKEQGKKRTNKRNDRLHLNFKNVNDH